MMKGCLTLTLLFIVCLGACTVFIGSRQADPAAQAAQRERDEKISVCSAAREFVRQRLKAPATAKFASCVEAGVAKLPSGDYTVMAWVDSQNNFGAMIRTRYLATLRPIGDKWQLVNLTTS
jgi:hypothetical protein